LHQRLQQAVTASTSPQLLSVPPVVQIDAIWVSQLLATGTYHREAKGRSRPDKKRIKRPVFMAMLQRSVGIRCFWRRSQHHRHLRYMVGWMAPLGFPDDAAYAGELSR
jgi:hypothetical protein